MKSLWKSLWMVCALAGVLAGAVGCGPQQAFCPNTGTKGGVCPIVGDDAQAPPGVDADNGCPTGQHFVINPVTLVGSCVPD